MASAFTKEKHRMAPYVVDVVHVNLLVLCRFKVFADYEDYIKCQEKVNALYKVCR